MKQNGVLHCALHMESKKTLNGRRTYSYVNKQMCYSVYRVAVFSSVHVKWPNILCLIFDSLMQKNKTWKSQNLLSAFYMQLRNK